MGRDFYAYLGVSKTCTDDELKKAYRKCAMRWHPDRHSSKSDKERDAASEKFKNVAEAYEVLSDKTKREVYDRYGEEGLKAGSGAPSGGGMGGVPGGFGGMPAGFGGFRNGATTFSFSSGGGGGGGGMDAARAQELFASLFGAGGLGGGLGGARFGGGSENDDPFANLLGGGMMGGGMGGGMMGGRRRRGGARSVRVDVLAPGATVRLTGLNDASHNNAVGHVDAFDEAKQRYVVSLSSGASIAVRPQNVRQVITTATVVGTSQEEINGATPAATTYDASSKRYRCEGLRPDGTVVSLRPENVMLPQECRVTIDGVSSRKELNGKIGRVRGVENDRYVVDLPNNEAVRLRFGAVAAC